jgi:hypothetical protein
MDRVVIDGHGSVPMSGWVPLDYTMFVPGDTVVRFHTEEGSMLSSARGHGGAAP